MASESKGKKSGFRPSRRAAVPPEIRKEILAEVASGRRRSEVARDYDIHPSAISRWKAAERERDGETEKPSQDSGAGASGRVVPPPGASLETGRYSTAFKEEVLRQLASGRKALEVAAQYRVAPRTVYRWKTAAEAAGGSLPPAKSTRPETAPGPSPIDEEDRRLVLSLKERHPNMGPAQLQNQLKRFHGRRVSRQMIGRIFAEAGIPLEKRTRDEDEGPATRRFEMSRPNELWAVDFLELWIHEKKAYALFLLDDFSRFCVGFALTEKPTAELAIETVEASIQRYGRPERILSDRGPQFHAWNAVSRFDRFLDRFLIDHTVTKANHPFTNGKVEAFHRSIERELLDVEELPSLEAAREALRRYVSHYNFRRTHMGIGGLVPADRYFGMVEEAQRALLEGLKRRGATMRWLDRLVTDDGPGCRAPAIVSLVLRGEKLELVVLGRRFLLG